MHNYFRGNLSSLIGGGGLKKEGDFKGVICTIELAEKEKNLIKLIRSIEYGELRITIQDKLPIRVEMVKKSIKL